MYEQSSLEGRSALITGVSRRRGIGYAVARELARRGASVCIHHHVPHDSERPWGADPGGIEAVLEGIREIATAPVHDLPGDLAGASLPAALVADAVGAVGHLDALVANHATSAPDGKLADVTVAALDEHWLVNTRATLLLAQAFAAQHDGREGGRIVLMTSGQQLGPMPGEVAYAASKAALAGITATLSEELYGCGISVNCVNPGPVDTGYMSPEEVAAVADRFPRGRWGEPEGVARVVGWLASPDGEWITGQTIDAEGGFRRS